MLLPIVAVDVGIGDRVAAAQATAPAPTSRTRWSIPIPITAFIRSFLALPTAFPGEMHRLGSHPIQQGHVVRGDEPNVQPHTYPDYSIYPQFSGIAYGFLSRGCPRNCGFCLVSDKEGRRSIQVADLAEFWNGQKEVKLLDANLLACPEVSTR